MSTGSDGLDAQEHERLRALLPDLPAAEELFAPAPAAHVDGALALGPQGPS